MMKAKYVAPTLHVHGTLEAMTQGASGRLADRQGLCRTATSQGPVS